MRQDVDRVMDPRGVRQWAHCAKTPAFIRMGARWQRCTSPGPNCICKSFPVFVWTLSGAPDGVYCIMDIRARWVSMMSDIACQSQRGSAFCHMGPQVNLKYFSVYWLLFFTLFSNEVQLRPGPGTIIGDSSKNNTDNDALWWFISRSRSQSHLHGFLLYKKSPSLLAERK